MDKHSLLEVNSDANQIIPDALDDDALLAELGIEGGDTDNDITQTRGIQNPVPQGV